MKKSINLIILSVILISGWFYFSYYRGVEKPYRQNREDVYFVVAKGDSVEKIGKKLQSENIIESDFNFRLYAWLQGAEADLQAGEYMLNAGMPISEIVRKLAGGEVVGDERQIKILEGWRAKDIDVYLAKQGLIADNEFYQAVIDAPDELKARFIDKDFIRGLPSQATFEGYLFPDTYRVFNDAEIEDIVEKMLINFDEKLDEKMRSDIAGQGRAIHEIVVMASIIEKEVRSPEDMKIVSGIFWDRIKYGQPLESCATLAYILGENKKQYTADDTKTPSPYNTYLNKGLPPGPISNPGLNALTAAIYPTYTDYNYFLNRFDNGETVFSRTYEEHLRNKNKYLR